MHSVSTAHARTPRPRTPWRLPSAIATLAIACAMLLGNAAAVADTLVSNLGQTAGAGTNALNNYDMAQSFRTGTSATGYMLEGVTLKFATAPASTDTITAIVTDGLGASSNTVATLTPPATWSTTSTFRAPANIVLAESTTYHVIVEATGTGPIVTTGQISRTTSNAEDTGGFSGWTIGDTYSRRGRTLGEGVGGTWNSQTQSINIAVLGEIVPIKVTSVAVTSTRPTSPGVGIVPYAIGDAITFAVTFSSAVDTKPTPRTDGKGRPWLYFQMGDSSRMAGWSNKQSTCDLVTNATQMTCRYTVAEGDEDTDGISLEANALHAVGAKIYAAGTSILIDPDYRIDSPAVAPQSNHPVDGVKPQLINTLARPAVTALDGTKIHLITTEPVGSCDPERFRVTANGTSNLVASCSTGTAGVPEDKVELVLDDPVLPDDTVKVTIDANAFLDSSSNGNLAIDTQSVRSAKLRLFVQNTSIVRGATDGYNYRTRVSWSTKDGVPIREDYEIGFTWNGAPLSELHPDNPDTITFGPNTVDSNGDPVRASIWIQAAADDNTDYQAPVTAQVVGTVGTFTASDDLTVIDDDGRPTASLSVPETVAEGTDFKVTANLSHTMDVDTTVHFTHQNPYDIDIDGYPDLPAIRVAAGSLTGESAAMRKRDDDVKDGWGDIHFSVNGTENLPFDGTLATVRITDDEATDPDRRRYLNDGTPTGNALNTVGHESGTGAVSIARFRVKVHDAKPGETYTFDYKTQDGNGGGNGPVATAGSDYVAKQGTLTFAPGETEKYVNVTILDDAFEDSNEAFLLVLSNPSSNAQLAPRSNGRCTILNHDPERVAASFPTSTTTSTSHTGSNDRPQVVVAFSQPIPSIAADSDSIVISGATLESHAAHTESGIDNGWRFTLAPTGYGDVTFALNTGVACADDGICTDAGHALTNVPATHTIAGPTGLIATFSNLPAENPGTDFTFDLNFNAELTAGWREITHAFIVDGGSIKRVSRKTRGSDLAWEVKVHPSGTEEMTISLVAPSVACSSQGAICSEEGNLPLSNRPSETVPAAGASQATPPSASIAGASGTEGTDMSIGFTVTLAAAATSTVTIDYATTDGTATAGSDYTSTSGTLTFAAGTTSQTITVPIADDSVNESDETFTVTLSNASGATLGTSAATGTIANRTVTVPPSASITSGAGATEGTDTSVVFTVTLDKAATGTVTLDYATSDGTASAGSDYTSTSGTLTFAAGTTSQTITVPIADDSVNESDETFTITLSNPSGASLGTSSASATIINRYVAPPLTASFANMPAEHGGAGEANRFTFDLSFSENVSAGFRKVKRAFAVTGGSVKKAQRKVQGSNQSWTITVEPQGFGDVSVTLPTGRTCGANNAICTSDNRQLSNSPSATVRGPASLAVADASANENTDDALEFPVTLDRASTLTVTVDYATSDGTATAGADYTATNGTLTFNPGETTKTVSVPVLDDAVDDPGETMTLTLSNAVNARIADATATGTITNHDALPAALTARFGRSVATHLLDALEERLDGSSQSYVRLGGHQLGGSPDVKEAVERLAPANSLSLWEEASADSASRTMTVKELLLGSAFNLVSNDGEDGIGPRLSAWGRVATSGFDGQEDKLSLNGTVTTATLGVDGVWEHWLTGVALAYSEGDGSFTHAETPGGELASSLTSVHPYVAYALSDRVRLWGMVGYGSGSLQLRLAEQDALDTDLSMTMGALGVRGSLLEPSQPEGGLALALRSDVLWLRMDTAAIAGMVGTEADVSRLRLVLEGSRPVALAAGGLLIPTLEVGLRHDGGDAETGSGVEVGGSLRYTSAWGLSLEASVRGLLAHEASDYQEWGASGALRFDAGQQGRGLTASIMPTWGSAASGVNRLWGQPQASGLAPGNPLATAAAGRLDAELGYGVAALRGRGLLTPYVRAALAEGSERAWHLGARLGLAESLNLSLEASRRQRDGDAAAHELALLATLGW